MADPKTTFGGDSFPDRMAPQAELDDPAYGADATLTLPPDQAQSPEPRLPNFTDYDEGALGAINDDEVLTESEQADRLFALAGLIQPEDYDHNENMADALDEQWLSKTGQEILQLIDRDIESRKPWQQRFEKGLEILGLKDFIWDKDAAPFDGASTAVHPMLAEAVVQSQARLMEEIFPAGGPVKSMVMGQEDAEKRDAADRVQNHMNYQLTVEDETYFMESQKMGIYLPIFGTAYRKAYHDYVEDQNVLRYIPGEDMILPYKARNLKSSPRKTHRYKIGRNELTQAMVAGAYRTVELTDPAPPETDTIKQSTDKLDSVTETAPEPGDGEWTLYETDMRLDIPGHEDKDQDGRPTGVALPYTITTEMESGKILAIRRCWKEQDPLKKMRTRYAEYWYLPGLGAYGMGLIHWIGGLAEAGTDALRALLDSATWANLQGGFKAKDAGVKAGELEMSPGVWKDVDMTSDELSKAFHTPPVKEPSEALFKLLGFLTEQAQRFASTTDKMVGDQDSKGAPVGTTIALIEQGSKVYSGVHKRAHFAAGIEFRMLFDLNAEYIPEEGYPYQVPGDDLAVYKADYDTTKVSIVPVSDPNIFSQTQRIALAQTRYQIAKENPPYFRMYEVLDGLLKSFKDPDRESTLINPDEVPPMDPLTENIAMATGRPVKAKDGENHDAHLVNHMAFFQHPQFGGMPEAQELLGPAMMAHVAEHVALKYADVMRQGGVPLPKVNLSAPNGESVTDEMDPQQANIIAIMGAGMVGQFLQSSGLTTTPPGEAGAAEAQAAEDQHELNAAKKWATIANALAALAKAGKTIQDGMLAQAVVEAGDVTGGAAEPPNTGALGPTPGPAGPRVPPPVQPVRAPAPQGPRPPVAPAGGGPATVHGGGAHDEQTDGPRPAATVQPAKL